jgi:predicted outer membrane lipoprotein
MFTAIFSVSLITLAIAFGVAIPWLGLHLELMNQRKRAHEATLKAHLATIKDHEATIGAYRQAIDFTIDELQAVPQRG